MTPHWTLHLVWAALGGFVGVAVGMFLASLLGAAHVARGVRLAKRLRADNARLRRRNREAVAENLVLSARGRRFRSVGKPPSVANELEWIDHDAHSMMRALEEDFH